MRYFKIFAAVVFAATFFAVPSHAAVDQTRGKGGRNVVSGPASREIAPFSPSVGSNLGGGVPILRGGQASMTANAGGNGASAGSESGGGSTGSDSRSSTGTGVPPASGVGPSD